MDSMAAHVNMGVKWVWSLMDMVSNEHGHSLFTNNKWINGYELMDVG